MKPYSSLFFLIIILILTIFMIINPDAAVEAATEGLKLWALVVVPALFPFFVAAELMFSLGLPYVLGFLLEPVMQPLFRLPGSSAIVVVMGFTSGFPVGALLSRKLYDENLLTAEETERLAAFTNNCSPLFILGAVGVGMFASKEIGILLAFSHYLGNLAVGLLGRFFVLAPTKDFSGPKNDLKSSWLSFMDRVQALDIGVILLESIKKSLNNILAVGGFIVIFSVIARMLALWGFMGLLGQLFESLLFFLGLSWQGAYGIAMGFFEMTIGTMVIAASDIADLSAQLTAVSIVLAFSGLSVIAQIMSIFAGTPMRLSFYLKSRLLHMIFSGVITYVISKYWLLNPPVLPAIKIESYKYLYSFDALTVASYSILCCFLLLGILILASACKRLTA